MARRLPYQRRRYTHRVSRRFTSARRLFARQREEKIDDSRRSHARIFQRRCTGFIHQKQPPQKFEQIRLSGDNWSVGLVEIHVPNTIEHVSDEEAAFSIDNSRDNIFHRFKSGNFQSLEDLITSINDSPDFTDHLQIGPSLTRSGYYCIERLCSCKRDHKIIFHNKILDVLGFERAPRMILSPTSNRVIEATRPASLVLPANDQLYVYCDVCLPSFVGDTQSSLLRIVTLDSSKTSFGRSIVRYFAPPHYVPVLHRNFQTISLDIRTSQGVNPPFTSGTLLSLRVIQSLYDKLRKMDYIIDLQGYVCPDGKFLPKEIAVVSLLLHSSSNWIISPPDDYLNYSTEVRKCIELYSQKVHGIQWPEGSVCADKLYAHLKNILLSANNIYIFVDSSSKKTFLEILLGQRKSPLPLESNNKPIKKRAVLESRDECGPFLDIPPQFHTEEIENPIKSSPLTWKEDTPWSPRISVASPHLHAAYQRINDIVQLSSTSHSIIIDVTSKSRADADHANGSVISTYGSVVHQLELGLRHDFAWSFIHADVPYPILGADALAHFDLMPDLKRHRLIDNVTKLSVKGQLAPAPVCSISAIDPTHPLAPLLSKYPQVINPARPGSSHAKGVLHHLQTTGGPTAQRARRLAPDKFSAAR
ncbi:unnamed protein product [Trichogramma brassicae]|uniref:Uncharacterized protein n=1 Tax=Trichogramma brassicae TaxID=86971 RepID=A0A6H5IAQ7_9HYME|nr:unnamed protein product [Trichogramma brassicae]